MPTTTFTESPRTGDFILSEADNTLSRETVTIASGAGKLVAGTVLAQLKVGAATASVKASGANTGNGTVGAVTLAAAGVKIGTYKVRFTAATAFTVADPDGFQISTGTTGAAFADDLGFTITAGGTAFVAGDGFDITVVAGSGKYVTAKDSGADGSQTASAILYRAVDATSADAPAVVIYRHAEVKAPMLVFDASINSPTKVAAALAQLATKSIVAR